MPGNSVGPVSFFFPPENAPLLSRSCSEETLSSGDFRDGHLQVSVVLGSRKDCRVCRVTCWFEVILFSYSHCCLRDAGLKLRNHVRGL